MKMHPLFLMPAVLLAGTLGLAYSSSDTSVTGVISALRPVFQRSSTSTGRGRRLSRREKKEFIHRSKERTALAQKTCLALGVHFTPL